MTRLRIPNPIARPIIASIALTMLAFVPISAAQAATSTVKPPPNPCTSFTSKSLHSLFAVSSGVKLTTTLTSTGTGINQAKFCTVTYGKRTLRVVTELRSYGFGGPFKCYKQATLGTGGQVCLSTVKGLQATWGMFKKYGVYFFNCYTVTLPSKGARMYSFTLAQYNSFKG